MRALHKFLFAITLLLIFCALFFTPEVMAAPEIATGIGTSPSDPDFYAKLLDAIANHNWRYVAMVAVIGITWVVRFVLAERIPALKKGKWTWTVAVAGSALAALSTFLASNATVTALSVISTLLYGAFVGLAAAGTFKGLKEFANNQ